MVALGGGLPPGPKPGTLLPSPWGSPYYGLGLACKILLGSPDVCIRAPGEANFVCSTSPSPLMHQPVVIF